MPLPESNIVVSDGTLELEEVWYLYVERILSIFILTALPAGFISFEYSLISFRLVN